MIQSQEVLTTKNVSAELNITWMRGQTVKFFL